MVFTFHYSLSICLQRTVHHMFAADVQLFKSFELVDINGAVRTINQGISAVSQWARDNNLILNTGKTKASEKDVIKLEILFVL